MATSETTTAEVVPLLRKLKPRFFDGLTSSEVSSIVAAATRRRFPAHSVITHEGFPANHLFLMIHGRARSFCLTPQGEKVPLLWIPPGEIFGGSAFLSKQVEYLAGTETVNHSSALVWDRSTIRSLSAQYSRLMENALLIAFDYMVVYRALHLSATCQNARQRLAQVLGNLANGMGQRVEQGVALDVRNEELANEANITIFTASRVLSEWRRKGILTKSRGKIVLRSPEALMLSEA